MLKHKTFFEKLTTKHRQSVGHETERIGFEARSAKKNAMAPDICKIRHGYNVLQMPVQITLWRYQSHQARRRWKLWWHRRHSDRHFLKMVKSCSGHLKTCKSFENRMSGKFSWIQCFFLMYKVVEIKTPLLWGSRGPYLWNYWV